MDIAQIANQVVALLVPAMSALGSSVAAEAFYKEFGKDAWHFVKSLWTRLEPAVHVQLNLKQAVEALQSAPTDKLNETVLSARLQQALQADATHIALRCVVRL